MRALTHGQSTVWAACGVHLPPVSLHPQRSTAPQVCWRATSTSSLPRLSVQGRQSIYAFVVTYILATIVDKTIGLRVTEEEEYVGLDISQHGERA